MAVEISVYALSVLSIKPGTEIDLDPANWQWAHFLTIPLETLNALQFSQRPYKWIRYAIGVVIGSEGVLSTSSDSLIPVDDNATPPAESANLYYYTSDEEKRGMALVVPHIQIASGTYNTWREFSSKVAERDGNRCVMTGHQNDSCHAAHLLKHSDGDNKFISILTQGRSRDPTGDDIIHDIHDVRNGLFLAAHAHMALLNRDLAFLVTPNFAMNTSDIDPTAPPTEKRCTPHLFRLETDLNSPWESLRSYSQLRLSDTPEYPPAILFDAAYAGVVLKYFGAQTLVKKIVVRMFDSFYPRRLASTDDEPVAEPPSSEVGEMSEAVEEKPL